MGAAQPLLSSSLLGKGFDGHEAQPVAGGLVAVDDPTECKLAYFGVVSHPAGETVAHLIDKFLQRRSAQRLWFAWLRPGFTLGTSSPSCRARCPRIRSAAVIGSGFSGLRVSPMFAT